MALIARLAIDQHFQGNGYGRDLLVYAIELGAKASAIAAARFIAVGPIDESARNFYSHFGFVDVVGDPSRRMYLRLDHALEAMTASIPQEE
jgi:GNAT superfamily N-acetyltransferase